MKKSLTLMVMALAAATTLSACINVPYKAPTQQGNWIEVERVPMIQEGMTREQVANTIGSPILQDIFHADRWDYIYRLDKHYTSVSKKRVTIWFKNNIVVKVERDLPAEQASAVKK